VPASPRSATAWSARTSTRPSSNGCAGAVDILEPGLPDLVAENLAAGRLEFVLGGREAVAGRDGEPVEVVFLCVPTPMGEGGAADLTAVRAVTGHRAPRVPRASYPRMPTVR
jgi:UDP-glucose 6-dehydrogenase